MKIKKFKKLYYSIKEVSAHFDVAASLLRYWESEFDLLSPKRNKKGVRFYSKSDILLIEEIHHLVKVKGYTLIGAMDELKDGKRRKKKTKKIIKTLEEVKSFLEDLKTKV